MLEEEEEDIQFFAPITTGEKLLTILSVLVLVAGCCGVVWLVGKLGAYVWRLIS